MSRAKTPWEIFFFFNDTATTEIYTLSLHDALPIFLHDFLKRRQRFTARGMRAQRRITRMRSEEHTSELQSQSNLVCRLLLEKKSSPVMTRCSAPSITLDRESVRHWCMRT